MAVRKSAGRRLSNVSAAFVEQNTSLRKFVARYFSNRQDIEDVAQEAYLRAYVAERKKAIEQPKAFLFRIAKNVALTNLSKKSRRMTDYLEDAEASAALETASSAYQEAGVFAANAALRAAITPAGRGSKAPSREPEQPTPKHVAPNWARRLKRVFGIETEHCARCGGRLEVIASIEEPELIERILAHRREQGGDGDAPMCSLGARAPPQAMLRAARGERRIGSADALQCAAKWFVKPIRRCDQTEALTERSLRAIAAGAEGWFKIPIRMLMRISCRLRTPTNSAAVNCEP